MKKRTKIMIKEDRPVGLLREIQDFLPSPEKLVATDEMVKVTIALDRGSLNFFKKKAEHLGTKYQKMIREVIRGYAARWG